MPFYMHTNPWIDFLHARTRAIQWLGDDRPSRTRQELAHIFWLATTVVMPIPPGAPRRHLCRRLFALGLNRHRIATVIGRSPATVTRDLSRLPRLSLAGPLWHIGDEDATPQGREIEPLPTIPRSAFFLAKGSIPYRRGRPVI